MEFILKDYPFTVDTIHLTFLAGLLISYIYYKKRNVSVGGSLAIGYLAAACIYPLTVIFTIVAALVALAIIKYVVLRIWLPRPRQIFGIGLLVGIILGAIWLAISTFILPEDSLYANLSIVGVIVPGMLCNSLNKQGLKRTLIPMVWMIPLSALIGIFLAWLMTQVLGTSISEMLFSPDGFETTRFFVLCTISVLMAVLLQDGPFSKYKLRTGGYVTSGVLFATFAVWPYFFLLLIVALILWGLETYVGKFVALHGKDRFVVLVLASAVLTTLGELLIVSTMGIQVDGAQNLIMVVLPAIIANDLIQYGPKKTGIGLGAAMVGTAAIGALVSVIFF